ncbi:MAG: metallophosphoesterase [Oligoflexia bacterium]|nr:metallophosphoesterase [Oligoflexia bacterium]
MSNIRFLIFATIMTLMMAFVWQHVWFRLAINWGLPEKIEKVFAFLFIASFLLQIWRFIIFRSSEQSFYVIFAAYFLMGLFTHLFFAALTKDLLLFIPLLKSKAILVSQTVTVIAVLFNLWGVKTAIDGPIVRFVKVATKRSEISGFKIAQISDLHVGPLIKKNYVENVVSKINKLNADIVVMTGDMGDGDATDFSEDLEPFKNLKSKYGLFYVPGNHEYYWKADEWVSLIEAKGVKALLNDGVKISNFPIWLGGVTDFMDPNTSPQQAIEKNQSSNNYKILLAHQPKSVFKADKAGFDLMLSGHTHWGQFFPFNLIVGFFNPYSKSLNVHNSRMHVYVNAGTGFWGPPVRLGVPSEITLLELTQ